MNSFHLWFCICTRSFVTHLAIRNESLDTSASRPQYFEKTCFWAAPWQSYECSVMIGHYALPTLLRSCIQLMPVKKEVIITFLRIIFQGLYIMNCTLVSQTWSPWIFVSSVLYLFLASRMNNISWSSHIDCSANGEKYTLSRFCKMLFSPKWS